MSGFVWNQRVRRFSRQFREAQRWLDQSVLRDAEPFVPKRSGRLVKSGKAVPGGGVQWTAPYAAAVYYRKKKNPSGTGAQRLWFEAAKARYASGWVRGVKKRAGGS